jgi:hypothetical protein
VNDRIRQLGRFIQGTVKESAQQTLRDHGDEEHRNGFTRAAGISLRQIQEKIDSFKEQMKGPGLTKAEQLVYNQLDELKSELEAGFDRYWRDTGVDWRPPKPIAKVVKQPGKSQ